MAVVASSQLNFARSPTSGSWSVHYFEKLEQIGERQRTMGKSNFMLFLLRTEKVFE